MSPLAIAFTGPRSLDLVDEPDLPLAADQVRVRTLFSGISAGTEMSAYRGTNPYLLKRWDDARRLFVPAEPGDSGPSITYPVVGYGYEEVGEVIEAGAASGLAVGSRVYGTWGHRARAVVPASLALDRVLPAAADPLLGIFSHIGPTALNGVIDAAPRLGETVALFGLGVVGQLTAQLLKRAGARVIAVDLIEARRQIAARLGADVVLDPTTVQVAEEVRALTDGRGADVCIEASGSTRALHEAIRACAYGSRVVALGFYQGEAAGLMLGEEFHHNRVQVVSSQIGGLALELQGRWNRLRLVHTFMDLAVRGELRCIELVSHRVPLTDAAALFRLIDERPHEVLQAVLDFTVLP